MVAPASVTPVLTPSPVAAASVKSAAATPVTASGTVKLSPASSAALKVTVKMASRSAFAAAPSVIAPESVRASVTVSGKSSSVTATVAVGVPWST